MTESSVTQMDMLDTNVLVYAYDTDESNKHEIAQQLLARSLMEKRLVLSVQALNEFYSVITRKNRAVQYTHEKACSILSHLASACAILPVTQQVTFRALDAVALHSMSFWDALIWAAAAENGISTVYTEDFQNDRVIEGVQFCNPFAAD